MKLTNPFSRPNSKRASQVPLGELPGGQLLAIEWADDCLRVAALKKSKNSWTTECEISFSVAGDLSTADGQAECGQQLAAELAQHQVHTRAAAVSITASRAVLKHIEIADVPEEQVADAVLLQAETRGFAADQYAIDFVPTPDVSDGKREVCMAAIPVTLLTAIQTTLNAADLDLRVIGLGEFGLARSLTADSTSSHVVAIADAESIELVAIHGRRPLAAVQLRLPQDASLVPKLLAGHLKRLHSTPSGPEATGNPAELILTGPQCDVLAQTIAGQIDCPIRICSVPTRWAKAWGIATDTAPSTERLDFLNPRRSPDMRALRREKTTRILVRSGLAAMLVFLLFQMYLGSLEKGIEALRTEIAALERQTTSGIEILDKADQLNQWRQSQIQWPAEVLAVLSQVPDNDRVVLSRIQLESSLAGKPEVRIEGVAREVGDALRLNERLIAQSPRFQIRPEQLERTDSDPHYHAGFAVVATVNPVTKLPGEELSAEVLAAKRAEFTTHQTNEHTPGGVQ